ncbi:hypothetical protein AaE_001577 [Aphanomyces astaci]|uniref:Uncharacterized protein n=1 Tax=Aphanomyces astaci TaxID=112090 RepID=A0A6A5AYK3_APHAT|nr:hypothetical protein AaE_001577 [Aphanomyces astaci]
MNVSVKSPRASAKPGARSVVPSDSLPSRRSVVELPPNARRNFRQRHRAAKALDQPRNAVGAFVTHIKVELFFISIVICYGIFVLVQMTFESQLKVYQDEFDLVDLVVSSVLTVELLLRLFGTLQTPIETVLGTLYELRYQPSIKPSVQNEIDYAIYCIKNNKLYDAGEHMLNGQNIDKDTQDWLRDGLLRKNDASAVTPSPAATDVGGGDDGKAGRPGGGGIGSLRKENSGITDELFPLTESARSHFNDLMTTVADWDFDVFRLQGTVHEMISPIVIRFGGPIIRFP